MGLEGSNKQTCHTLECPRELRMNNLVSDNISAVVFLIQFMRSRGLSSILSVRTGAHLSSLLNNVLGSNVRS